MEQFIAVLSSIISVHVVKKILEEIYRYLCSLFFTNLYTVVIYEYSVEIHT